MTRRDLLAGLGAAAALQAQEPKPRTQPMLCVFSKNLSKLEYMELGPVIRDLGFEGCDLTVRPGGHVIPERAPADLVRAIEVIQGEGVAVPMITTALVTPADPTAVNVLGLSGRMKVQYFKPGYWRYRADDPEAEIARVQQNLSGLVAIGRHFNMVCGFHNHSGDYVGEATWDTRAILAGLDPRWAGYYFDPCHATAEGGRGGWLIAMRLALPRMKMVALKDFYWEKSGGQWTMRMCPMGEGMVDWPKVFSLLAAARFTGPMSLHVEYNPTNELAAMSRDLDYVKKQLKAAYASNANVGPASGT